MKLDEIFGFGKKHPTETPLENIEQEEREWITDVFGTSNNGHVKKLGDDSKYLFNKNVHASYKNAGLSFYKRGDQFMAGVAWYARNNELHKGSPITHTDYKINGKADLQRLKDLIDEKVSHGDPNALKREKKMYESKGSVGEWAEYRLLDKKPREGKITKVTATGYVINGEDVPFNRVSDVHSQEPRGPHSGGTPSRGSLLLKDVRGSGRMAEDLEESMASMQTADRLKDTLTRKLKPFGFTNSRGDIWKDSAGNQIEFYVELEDEQIVYQTSSNGIRSKRSLVPLDDAQDVLSAAVKFAMAKNKD